MQRHLGRAFNLKGSGRITGLDEFEDAFVIGGWLWLDWQGVRDANGDLIAELVYNVYRGDSPDFVPSVSTFRGSTQDTTFVDEVDAQATKGFYVVVAELP